MYKKLSIGVAVPAYNEEKLIQKTLSTMPEYVDHIVVVNDASQDDTLRKIQGCAKNDSRIIVIDNTINGGIGYSLKKAILRATELGADRVAVMAGDAQMDPARLKELLDDMDKRGLDFIKANRFMHFDALKAMPRYRRFGNVIVTLLTKFSTGYYTIFDTQNGYVVYSRNIIERLPWHMVGNRYEFENTVLVALSIVSAKVGDYPIPALYGEEKSTIKLFSTTMRVLKVLVKGFWQRVYYKYVLYGFHPIALFLLFGTLLSGIGFIGALWTVYEKIWHNTTPTSGTVMLFVLPIIVGLQMLLTALILDVIEEGKS
ncbi:glycosyltransferase family 2 protein [Candidatus Saccharibacteria bacterium]|nr:glycosyltransferase family 2 protein [Candidatus Saccharibacteria bacterium]